MLAVNLHRLFDLGREFAGGGQNQAAWAAGLHALQRVVQQTVQNGQCKASGFAGAGLGGGQQVTAFDDLRNGLGLDGGGCGVTGFGNSTQKGISQPEVGERNRCRQERCSGDSLSVNDTSLGGREKGRVWRLTIENQPEGLELRALWPRSLPTDWLGGQAAIVAHIRVNLWFYLPEPFV